MKKGGGGERGVVKKFVQQSNKLESTKSPILSTSNLTQVFNISSRMEFRKSFFF